MGTSSFVLVPKARPGTVGLSSAPTPGEQYWAQDTKQKPVLVEVSSVELAFRSGWSVWAWPVGAARTLTPRKFFVPRALGRQTVTKAGGSG